MTWPEPGGNWQGGYLDHHGNRWLHIPNQGWTADKNYRPYLLPTPRRPWWRRILHLA